MCVILVLISQASQSSVATSHKDILSPIRSIFLVAEIEETGLIVFYDRSRKYFMKLVCPQA